MIGRNIQQNADICLELVHVIQHKAAQLQHVDDQTFL